MSRTRDDLLSDLDLLGFEREVLFRGLSGKRRWRFDSAYTTPDGRTIAVEYHGKGAHTSYIQGTFRDHEKATEAALSGITLIQCNAKTAGDGTCWSWVMMALGDET